eukprot:CCRYP_005648-RB/>CCRYP_005648-RB protein AED:0.02 eAED:0.02 QI:624/1/1/1/0/0.5/2/64/538
MLDATPDTLIFPQRVFDIYSQDSAGGALARLKLIFVLREPVEREFSRYHTKAADYRRSTDKRNGWFSDVVDEDGSLMTFDQYTLRVLRVNIKKKLGLYGSGFYAMHLKAWAGLFNRKRQILVLNYDEIRNDPSKVRWRIETFLGKKLDGGTLSASDAIESIPQRVLRIIEPLFRKPNEELYDFLRDVQGPLMEQRPFPKFLQRTIPKNHTGLLLPNVLLIGAQKAGTTAVSWFARCVWDCSCVIVYFFCLHCCGSYDQYLQVAQWMFSNGVCNPKSFDGEPSFYEKEVQFFDNEQRYKQGIDFYAKRFDHCGDEGLDEFILDATPNTIEFPQRVHNIYSQPAAADLKKKLKLILILREPIERELSAYNHKVFDYKEAQANGKIGWVNGTWYRDVVHKHDGSVKTFTEYCEFIKGYMLKGAKSYTVYRYVEHLKAWSSLFDRSQLLVLSYDELRKDPAKVQWRIEHHLGTKFYGTLAKLNESGGHAKVKEIPESAIQVLDPLIRHLNEELYEFLRNNPGPTMEQRPFPRFDGRSSEIIK